MITLPLPSIDCARSSKVIHATAISPPKPIVLLSSALVDSHHLSTIPAPHPKPRPQESKLFPSCIPHFHSLATPIVSINLPRVAKPPKTLLNLLPIPPLIHLICPRRPPSYSPYSLFQPQRLATIFKASKPKAFSSRRSSLLAFFSD